MKVAKGSASREDLLGAMREGLFVTSLVPLSAPGSESFVAEVRGVWVENGRARRAVARTLLVLGGGGAGGTVVERGADAETDRTGPPVTTPTLLLAGATLLAM